MKDKIKGVIAQLQSLLEEGEGKEHEYSEDSKEEEPEGGAQVTDMNDTFNDDVKLSKSSDSKKKSMGVISAMLAKKMKDKC
jgi:hypothetical protein